MGLGPAAVKLNLELWQRGVFDGIAKCMDLGAQELQLARAQFFELLSSGGPRYDEEAFQPWAWPEFPRCTTRPFYELLGITETDYLDLNGQSGAFRIDLNKPLPDDALVETYDLVTDYGTNEHVFNVAEAYRTMYRLARVGGILINVQAVYRGNGYFLYDYPFFEEFAQANDLEVVYSSYIVRVPVDGGTRVEDFHVPVSTSLLEVLDWARVGEIGICYVFRKVREGDLVLPYSYGHGKQRAPHGYHLQFVPQSPIRRYAPLASPTVEEARTKDLAVHLARRVGRKAGSLSRALRARPPFGKLPP